MIAMEYTSLISVQVHISLANKTSDTDKLYREISKAEENVGDWAGGSERVKAKEKRK